MGITENAAYLKGLADGLNISESSSEGKLILKMLELIGDMADKLEALTDEHDELYGYVESMAEDLVNLEDDVYGISDEEYEDYSDLNDGDLDDEDYMDDEYYEVECPTCGEKICFTEEMDLDNFSCPACGNKIDDIELVDECLDCEGCSGEGCSEECDGCAKAQELDG